MMDKPGIIVLGGHVQALGILKTLGSQGIKGIIIDSTKTCIARHSRYCQMFYQSPDPEILDLLLNPDFKLKYKGWLIFPTNDFHVKILSQNKSKLEGTFKVTTDHWDAIKYFYDKTLTYQLTEKLGIPYPKTWSDLSATQVPDLDVDFPCIVKPAIMHDFYRVTKKKVFVCRDKKELIENFELAKKIIPENEIIIQDIIPGLGRNQYSACLLYLNQTRYIGLTGCRVRQHPIDFGNATTYAETIDIPLLLEYGQRLLEAVNYNGLCEIEFKYDERDQSYKFLEVNPRTWKWHTIANKSQTPFLPMLYDHLTGTEIRPVTGFSPASFRHTLTDFPVQVQLLLKNKKHWKGVKKPVEPAVWNKHDVLPWIYEKIYLINLIKSR